MLVADLIHLCAPEDERLQEPEMPLEKVRRAIWGMLYADDAGIASRSPQVIAKIMTVVEVCRAFGLTVSEKKTATMCMHARGGLPEKLDIRAAGHTDAQTSQFVCRGGSIAETPHLTAEVHRRCRLAWWCFQRYKQELYDRPDVPLMLKVRMLKAEAVETLLYACVTWAALKAHFNRLRTAHHHLLLRVAGSRLDPVTNHVVSYFDVLAPTDCESTETTVRRRRLLWAGSVARAGPERLHHRHMHGELERPAPVEGEEERLIPRGQEKQWTACRKDDLNAFESCGDWREASTDIDDRWCPKVDETAKSFLRGWHEKGQAAADARHEKMAAKEAETAAKLAVVPGVTPGQARVFRDAFNGGATTALPPPSKRQCRLGATDTPQACQQQSRNARAEARAKDRGPRVAKLIAEREARLEERARMRVTRRRGCKI